MTLAEERTRSCKVFHTPEKDHQLQYSAGSLKRVVLDSEVIGRANCSFFVQRRRRGQKIVAGLQIWPPSPIPCLSLLTCSIQTSTTLADCHSMGSACSAVPADLNKMQIQGHRADVTMSMLTLHESGAVLSRNQSNESSLSDLSFTFLTQSFCLHHVVLCPLRQTKFVRFT